jgi:hypothetical protein
MLTELKDQVLELNNDITRIEVIMANVSTDSNCFIQDYDEEYKEILFSINSKIHRLKKQGLEIDHQNTYQSLWDFYSYWKINLPSYQSRRDHIRSLYGPMEQKINELLIEINENDYEVAEVMNDELYLEIENVPDDFYQQLIDLINGCYSKGIYAAVLIFCRKLLECLIVDILKKKYGTTDVTIFFDKQNRRYHSFNTLLKEFESRLSDFKVDMPSLESKFIRSISKFREKGNVNAHVLELNDEKDKLELDKNKKELGYIVKVLIRLSNNVVPKTQNYEASELGRKVDSSQ